MLGWTLSPMAQFYSHLYDENYQVASTTTTHIRFLLQFPIYKLFVASFSTTMWYQTDVFAKQYHCEYVIYPPLFLALEFSLLLTDPLVHLYMKNMLLMV